MNTVANNLGGGAFCLATHCPQTTVKSNGAQSLGCFQASCQSHYPWPSQPQSSPPSPRAALPTPFPRKPGRAALTSSQVPGDEAEEEADDAAQLLLAALLAFLQAWAGGLATPCHLSLALFLPQPASLPTQTQQTLFSF